MQLSLFLQGSDDPWEHHRYCLRVSLRCRVLIADELMKAQNSNQDITTLLEEQLEPLIQQGY